MPAACGCAGRSGSPNRAKFLAHLIVDPVETAMALLQAHPGQTAKTYQDLGRILLFVAAAIVLMLVATAIFGVQVPGPSYDIVPDPAGLGMPF